MYLFENSFLFKNIKKNIIDIINTNNLLGPAKNVATLITLTAPFAKFSTLNIIANCPIIDEAR